MSAVKEGWTYKKLGEVCVSITDGSHNPPKGIDYSDYRMISSQNVFDNQLVINDDVRYLTEEDYQRENNRTRLTKDVVLLTIVGTIGRSCVLQGNEGYLTLQRSVAALHPSSDIVSRYLMHCLIGKRNTLDQEAHGIAQKGIYLKQLSTLVIPIPPLPTQQSIVSELDKINELIALKKSQLKDLDTLAQSIFYDMFGDPITNEKEWEVKKLSDLSKEKLSYGSGASAIQYDGETRYVRITDINDNGDLNDDIVSPSVFDNKYLLNDGDILFARSGATVGKTYLHKEKDGKCIYAGYLIRFIPIIKCVLPIYVLALTKTHYYRLFISNTQRAVAQPNINAKQYGDLLIPLPPLSLQHQFAERVESIERMKQQVQTAIKDLETLLASRMQYWFA